jgi:hypothetical protein
MSDIKVAIAELVKKGKEAKTSEEKQKIREMIETLMAIKMWKW